MAFRKWEGTGIKEEVLDLPEWRTGFGRKQNDDGDDDYGGGGVDVI
jgi:hypothetical protein